MAISSLTQQRISPLSYNSNESIRNTSNNNEKSRNGVSENKKSSIISGRNGLKRNIHLENLMKQKEQLMERKQDIMGRGLQSGEDASSIQQKLKEIDKQIQEVDKQINKLQIEEQRKAMGTDDKNKKMKKAEQADKTGETNQEAYEKASTENLDKLMSVSKSLSKVKALSKEKKAELGEKRVLENEIKIDIERGVNPAAKEERVSQIEDNADNIDEKAADSYKEIHEKTTKNNKRGNLVKNASQSYTENMKDEEEKKNSKEVNAMA